MRNTEKDELEMAQRRERMLSEGFRLFAEKGIEAVSMQDVANACNLGVATLYRYYNTKLALVIAIGVRQWEDYGAYVLSKCKENRTDKMTAAEEFGFSLDFYIDLYRNHSDLLHFNQNFNNYVQHEGATKEQMAPYVSAVGAFAKFFRSIYEKAASDGTMRTELPVEKMFTSTAHIMLAVAVRYAHGLLYSGENAEKLTEEFLLLKHMILKEFTVEK